MLSRIAICRGGWTLRLLEDSLKKTPFCVLSSEPYRVIHDRQKQLFTVRLNVEGKVQSAVLKYSYRSDGHVQLLSTDVPESFRGKGVAANLAKAALDFVVEERLNASISCWYIKKYIYENPYYGYKVHIED